VVGTLNVVGRRKVDEITALVVVERVETDRLETEVLGTERFVE
jgi:hypothetical protein